MTKDLKEIREKEQKGFQGKSNLKFPDITMDGTSVTEISIMENKNYSSEINENLIQNDNIKYLLNLKRKKDPNDFLKESRRHIIDTCRSISALKTHTSAFTVQTMYRLGIILNGIYEIQGTKGKYNKWLKENIGTQHIRYLQQARQINKMGEFALKNAALGKNRLLEFYRIQNTSEYEEILKKNPYPDITKDDKGVIFKEHTDAIITLYNLWDGGIVFADFHQAHCIASLKKGWIEKKQVEKIKNWIDQFSTNEEKGQAFKDIIANKLVIPKDNEDNTHNNNISLNTILANLINYYETRLDNGQIDWSKIVDPSLRDQAIPIMKHMIDLVMSRGNREIEYSDIHEVPVKYEDKRKECS